MVLLLPALGGLVVGPLIWFLAREARGHGIPEVMEAVALRGGVMRRRAAAVKITASAVTLGSGGSAGHEGPIVQIGAALGSAIGQALRVPGRQLRTLVGCGAAAGLSATFNAPIAGAIFAVEVIVGDFAVAQFSPIVISSVVATVLSRCLLGNYPSFVVPAWELVSPFELAAYVVLGLARGRRRARLHAPALPHGGPVRAAARAGVAAPGARRAGRRRDRRLPAARDRRRLRDRRRPAARGARASA